MENSSLIELLKTLNTKELSHLLDFVENPYFTTGRYKKDAQILLKALLKEAPDYKSTHNSKEKIHHWAFSGSVYTEGRLEKAMVDAHKMLRQFLLVEAYLSESNQIQVNLDFAQILRKRGLLQKSTNAIKNIMETLKTKKSKVSDDYELLYKASYLSNTLETQKSKLDDVTTSFEYLDLAYYSNRLDMLNYHLLMTKTTRVESVIDLEKEIQNSKMFVVDREESPNLYIAQKTFHLYASAAPSIEDFDQLFVLLKEKEHLIEPESVKYYFTLLRSYCSILISNGNTELVSLLHKINVDNLEKGYFYYFNALTAGAYLNISSISVRIGQYQWAYDFIELHKDRILGDNETQDFYRLGLANYLFYTDQFERALDYIPVVSPHIAFHLLARRLELMIYYETGSNLLAPKIDAFKMYISRASKKTLSEDIRDQNANFVNLLHQIIYSKPGEPKRGETIIKRIIEKKQVPMSDWLIKKAKLLK